MTTLNEHYGQQLRNQNSLVLKYLVLSVSVTMVYSPQRISKTYECCQTFSTCFEEHFKIGFDLSTHNCHTLSSHQLQHLIHRVLHDKHAGALCHHSMNGTFSLNRLNILFLLSLAVQSVLTTLTADSCPKWTRRQVSSYQLHLRQLQAAFKSPVLSRSHIWTITMN